MIQEYPKDRLAGQFNLTIETFFRTKEGEQVISIYNKDDGNYAPAAYIVRSVFGSTLSENDVFIYWYNSPLNKNNRKERNNGKDRAKRSQA